MVHRRLSYPSAADGGQGVVNAGNGSPLEILLRMGKIIIDGGFSDWLGRQVDQLHGDLPAVPDLPVEGTDGHNILHGCQLGTVAIGAIVRAIHAFLVKHSGIYVLLVGLMRSHKPKSTIFLQFSQFTASF